MSCQFDFEIKLFTSKTSCLYTSYMSIYYNKRVLHKNESHLPCQREVTPLIWKRVNLRKGYVIYLLSYRYVYAVFIFYFIKFIKGLDYSVIMSQCTYNTTV